MKKLLACLGLAPKAPPPRPSLLVERMEWFEESTWVERIQANNRAYGYLWKGKGTAPSART